MTETEAAALELIVDILAGSPPGQDGTPTDDAWANAQLVLDFVASGQEGQQFALPAPVEMDTEEETRRRRASAGAGPVSEAGGGSSVFTTPGDYAPEPPQTKHKAHKTHKKKRALSKRLRVKRKWTKDE